MIDDDLANKHYLRASDIVRYYKYEYFFQSSWGFNVGEECRNKGRYECFKYALSEYNKAIEINPNNSQYHFDKGKLLEEFQLYYEAGEEYEIARKLEPTSTLLSYYAAGKILYILRRYEDALKEFDFLIQYDVKVAEYHEQKGKTLIKLNRLQDALMELNIAIQLNPNVAEYHELKGKILYRPDTYDVALMELNIAIQLNPNVAEYHGLRADILYSLKRYEEAVEECRQALALNEPDFPWLKTHRMETSAESSDEDLIHWKTAASYGATEQPLNINLNINKSNLKYQYRLAMSLRALGHNEDAFWTIREVVKRSYFDIRYVIKYAEFGALTERTDEVFQQVCDIISMQGANKLYLNRYMKWDMSSTEVSETEKQIIIRLRDIYFP